VFFWWKIVLSTPKFQQAIRQTVEGRILFDNSDFLLPHRWFSQVSSLGEFGRSDNPQDINILKKLKMHCPLYGCTLLLSTREKGLHSFEP
jgi:hypothetical protein